MATWPFLFARLVAFRRSMAVNASSGDQVFLRNSGILMLQGTVGSAVGLAPVQGLRC